MMVNKLQSSGDCFSTTAISAPIATTTNPKGIAVDPTGKFVYFANYASNSVSQFSIDASTGTLVSIGASLAARANPSGVAIDSSGKFAYVSNAGRNSVSMYSINASTGALTGLPPTVAGASPFAMAVLIRFSQSISLLVEAYAINPRSTK